MTDPIIANAEEAAATPANDPPASVGDITNVETDGTRAAVAAGQAKLRQMLGLKPGDPLPSRGAKPATKIAEPPTGTEDQARVSHLETPRRALTGELAKRDLPDSVRAEKLRALKSMLNELATPEEKQAKADATVEERREAYGVQPPTLPQHQQAEYRDDWADWERPLYDVADSHGLDGAAVRGLRDAAVTLGQEVATTGRPATDDELVAVFNRYKVPASVRADLVKLWRSIEGGGE